MKEMKTTTTTYKYNKKYRVDIVTTKDSYDAYLYEKNVAYKTLIFGCPKYQQSYEEFVELIESCVPDYIPDYKEDLEALNSYYNKKFFYERS